MMRLPDQSNYMYKTNPVCIQRKFRFYRLAAEHSSRSGNTRATFFFNLSCNIIAVQVETLCCACYHLRGQLVSQQNTMLQVEATCCEK